MKKLFLLTKTLLVMALLCVGASNAWATAVPYNVGTEGTGDEWASRKYSDAYEIAPGEIYHFTFTNTSYGSNNWNNWLLDCKATADTSVDDWYFTMRSDNYGWGTSYNATMRYADFVWDDFKTVMNGATVDMYVDYNSTDKIIRTYTTITKSATEWHYNFASKAIDQSSVFLFLSEELAVLNLTTAEKVASLPDGTYTLYKRTTTTTDCGEQWKDDDKDNIWVPNTSNANFTYAIDGGLSLANTASGTFKSSYSASRVLTPNENTTVSMTAVATMGVAPGRDTSYDYITIGGVSLRVNGQNQNAQVYVDGVAQGSTVSATRGASYTFNVEINQASGAVTYSVSGGATIAEATTSTSTVISNVVIGHNRGGSEGYNSNLKLTNIDITEEVQAVTMRDYTINYKLGENVVKTVAGSSSDGTVITASVAVDGEGTYDGNHYLIIANEAPSMTLTSGDNILNVSVRAPYTATLNVTKYIGGVAESPVVTNFTETDAKVCSWVYTYPMYVQKDGVYYIADETSSFGESGAFADGDVIYKTVNYTSPDYSVVYFGEPNETNGTNTTYSNGNTGYITGGVTYDNNSVIRLGTLPAGDYHLITNVVGNATRNVVVGDCSDTSAFPVALVTISTTGAKDETFTVDGSTPISISGKDQGSGKFNQSADVDYILVKASSVSQTIGSTGYTTFASSYALNISGMTASTGTIKAYYVTASDVKSSSVALTDLTGNVAAGTGMILEGTAGATITIPVVASGTDYTSTNMLVGCTANTDITASTPNYGNFYVLSATEAAFKKIKTWVDAPNTLTIPAGKAYLDTTGANVVGAPSLTFDFGDETTGVNDVRSKMADVRGDFFDLQGRKVMNPAKGLYIVNGKKVVIK